MREVIQGLIAAEGEARCLVHSAREAADHLVADAEQRAQDVLARTRQETHAEAASAIETAVEAARQERAKRLQTAANEIDRDVRMEDAMRDRLVDAVVRCVCGQP